MTADTRKGNADGDFNPFRELTKTFDQFKMPGADMSAFVDARRKDVEALVAANKVTYAALQSLAHTQSDMLMQAMQAMQGMQGATKGLLAEGAGGGKGVDMAKHTEAATKAWQKMLADMKQLAEMVAKAQSEAMAGLNERATENLAEAKGMARAK
jgi:hypothetical protein